MTLTPLIDINDSDPIDRTPLIAIDRLMLKAWLKHFARLSSCINPITRPSFLPSIVFAKH